MLILSLAAGLAMITAVAHSVLSERKFLGPLRQEANVGGVLDSPTSKRLTSAMFHLPSLCWIGMAISMLLLDPMDTGVRETMMIYAGIYAVSGIGNLWCLKRLHPGGILLLSTSALILLFTVN